jgi:hypothetical protein
MVRGGGSVVVADDGEREDRDDGKLAMAGFLVGLSNSAMKESGRRSGECRA